MNMITEDYVSFEVAKLLKDKGFDEFTFSNYAENGTVQFTEVETRVAKGCQRPTLQMAMKWFREIQGLNIYARAVWKDGVQYYGDWEPAVVGYDWFVESLLDNTYSKMSTKMSIEPFLTYEEACEAAIKYCLENLI
jgi:hypothetical protein